jgi:GNAT superfamily N-acetyltransferase
VSTIDHPDVHRVRGPLDDVTWRDLELRDIPTLAAFAPEGWRVALDAVLLQHVGRRYFHAWVAVHAGRIVAVGQGIVTGRTGWIGNIIVESGMRSRGLGSRMTQVVMAGLGRRGCSSLLLVATPMGESLYRKLGFCGTSEYVFLDVPRLPSLAGSAIRRLTHADLIVVLGIDARVSGETDGVFLPSFGSGLVLGEAPAAGLDLLRFKHAYFSQSAVVPATNAVALQFLMEHGARETARAPRMALGEEAAWRPECLFARATGYCG